jgi:hypothetical protein
MAYDLAKKIEEAVTKVDAEPTPVKRLRKGVHSVVVTKAEATKSKSGAPMIKATVANESGEAVSYLSFSERAVDYTLNRIIRILKVNEKLDQIEPSKVAEIKILAEQLNGCKCFIQIKEDGEYLRNDGTKGASYKRTLMSQPPLDDDDEWGLGDKMPAPKAQPLPGLEDDLPF